MKLDIWNSSKAKNTLAERIKKCISYKEKNLHNQWAINEKTINNSDGAPLDMGSDEIDDIEAQTTSRVGVNKAMKNMRYIHAQLSSNTPTAMTRSSTPDPEDRRRARAADRVLRYSLRQYGLQEKFDQSNLNTLQYGTGIIKTTWNPYKGAILDYTEDGDVIMEGDIDVKVISPWRVLIDPDAECIEDIRYIFEEITVTYEDAMYRWPKKKKLIESLMQKNGTDSLISNAGVVVAGQGNYLEKTESITLYEYWETGHPTNAMLGRYTVCTREGHLMEPIRANPFAFSAPPSYKEMKRWEQEGIEPEKKPPMARLPYHFLTDIDVPNQVWGKSVVEFEAPLQDLLNRVTSLMLDALQAHGIARLILPDGLDIAADSITNSSWDIVRTKAKEGMQHPGDPKFMEPMPLPAIVPQLMNILETGIDDMGGTNEAMFGQQSREQSGFSMQYAVNQGNLIRRRLFNKYVLQVESVYKAILDLVRTKWVDERTIKVLGREKAFELMDLKGADIDGGYDVTVEYGTSLSLDPLTRRQELMNLLPLLEKAQVPHRVVLSMMKLGELDVVDDMIQLAEDRQREIFETMIATGEYIKPEEFEDHVNMLAYALVYVMTTEFKYLDSEQKKFIRQHIRDRGIQHAKEQQPQQPPGTPGPAPGMEQVPGGMGNPLSAAPGAPTQPAEIS